MPVKILLNGSNGRMGRAISDSAAECGCEIAAACDIGSRPEDFIENCDVAVDFSFREATAALAELCAKYGKPLVIGTTGHTPEQRAQIENFSKITLDESYDIEIVEMHHRHKKDAPSGTAEKLKEIVCACRNVGEDKVCYGRHGQVGERPVGEIGVHALRGGSVVGDHTVIFAADGERLELAHKAADRKVFAKGALRAAKWLAEAKRAPKIYGMETVLFGE